jgi:membrane protein implicated in regulation of membrane protease activity
MPWWAWVLAGVVLLLLELSVGTFYLFFLGMAAIAVGLIVLFGVGGPLWLELLLFVILSTGLLLLLRRPLLGKFKVQTGSRDIDLLVGELAVASEAIVPGDRGKVTMRGSNWNAKNVGDLPLAAGQRCRVEEVNGLVLSVRAANP